MQRTTSTVALAGLAGLIAAGTTTAAPFPGYTDGFTNVQASGEPGHQSILTSVYGGAWATVTGDARSFTNGALTATRLADAVDAAGARGTNLMLDGSNAGDAGVTDQVWQDGVVAADARARYAGFGQAFGYRTDDGSGPQDETLFTVSGSGVNPGGEAISGPIPTAGGAFEWLRSGTGQTYSSNATGNSDAFDHMVTYLLTSTDGTLNGGRPVYLVFFEDKPGDTSDWDYNDLVVELAVLPLPAALGLGLAGLAGAGLARRRRALAAG